MGIFNGLFNKLSNIVHPDYFIFTGDECSRPFCLDLTDYSGYKKAYERCSPLSSVIDRCSKSLSNGRWWVVDEYNNDIIKKYPNISYILENPNPLQTFTEFLINVHTLLLVYGEVYLIKNKPVGIDYIESIWAINPENINTKFTKNSILDCKKIDNIISHYELSISGNNHIIPCENIIKISDNHQNLNYLCDDYLSNSRINALYHEINNILIAQEAIFSLNRDRGAMGILSNEDKDTTGKLPLKENEKIEIQEKLNNFYGLGTSQRKILLTNASLKWQPMSINVKELMLLEGMKQNVESIADMYEYPFGLLANQNGQTFNNKNEDKKTLYQDNIIPFSSIYEKKFTKFLGLKDGDRISIDFSHIECLMQGEKEKAESLRMKNLANEIAYRNGVISLEEWRLSLEMDEKPYGINFFSQNNN